MTTETTKPVRTQITLEEWKEKRLKEGFVQLSKAVVPSGIAKFVSVTDDWWVFCPELKGDKGASILCFADTKIFVEGDFPRHTPGRWSTANINEISIRVENDKKIFVATVWKSKKYGDVPSPEQANSNAKIICQAKSNFQLLQELESVYLNKKEVDSLTVFETGILATIQEAISKSL